jgi:hypothetical protein
MSFGCACRAWAVMKKAESAHVDDRDGKVGCQSCHDISVRTNQGLNS